jgi:signal transduction histidine kinase/ligand-binding sensor domain-containing protein/DNA-binding response OmpR family regulator
MNMRKILLLVIFCCAMIRQYGQSNDYQFSHLDCAQGLSNNHVTCLYKDNRGFMWFGTVSGLNRYDGYQFRVFKHDSKDPHSIGDNYIDQIFDGPEGKMWVALRAGGFNIYDIAHDRFDQDYTAYLRRLSLPEYMLLSIVPSRSGCWFVYRDNGLFHYGADGQIHAVRPDSTRPGSLDPALVADAREDGEGNCWVIHQNGLLEKIDGIRHQVVYRTTVLEKSFAGAPITCNFYIDRQNDLWISAQGGFRGTFYFHPATGMLQHLSQEQPGAGRLSSDLIYTAIQDSKGLVWLATDHGGVDIVDKKDWSVSTLAHNEGDRKSLAENSVTCIYRDSTGAMWLGTFKSGISYYHQNGLQFPIYRHQPSLPGSLSYNDVNNFVEDTAGRIWIGSNGGGLICFDRKHNIFRQYLHDPVNPNSLTNNIIVSLLFDKDGKLWIGTYFGGLDCFDGKKFIHYRHDEHSPGSLADDRVMCLYEDSEKNLWIGTLASGFDRLDRKKNCFVHYNSSQPNSIINNYVSSIKEDDHNNLWIATGFGIDVMVRNSGRFIHFSTDSNQLSSNNVTLLFRDSRQRMWAATREGLNLFLPEKKRFQSFTADNGLADNTIRGIEEDSLHELWVSTTNGLSRIRILSTGDHPGSTTTPNEGVRIHCRNYHEQDGLQGREFNERACMVTRDGSLIFGGPNGFNLFHPENIVNTGAAPPIVLTDLEIFNKSVHVGEQLDGHVVLNKVLSETREIVLRHNEDVFSIEFASLGYVDNARNNYAYTLEGFNKGWLMTDGKIRKATYTNLDAGEYTFRVRATDQDGEWYQQNASLKIIVLPPFWKSPLAYAIYVLLLAGILLVARRMIIQKTRMRFALEQERRETRRMHEMDMMKIRFFTNMSHELRTPLSLILAPVDKLLGNSSPSDPRKQYEVIRRNARRLLHLVNQLLDFRKMEVNELKLHPRQGDVLKFIKEISFSFIDLAERKNISFSYRDSGHSLLTLFDHDKIERILFNLLSNAFKFTPENGAVTVSVDAEYQAEIEIVMLSVKVTDTGIGIAPDKQEKIFERFFQNDVPDTILNQGSGIGLAITQEFVRMHNGSLSVQSQLDKGSCFIVSLPFIPLPAALLQPAEVLSTEALTASAAMWSPGEGALPAVFRPPAEVPQITAAVPDLSGPQAGAGATAAATADPGKTPPPGDGAKKGTLLIVEDNEDFRFYLKDNLRRHYSIIEAADGKEGWRKALAEHPDLIVSDISMPMMNGIDLCKKILADERTCQIPVILLTAMTGEGAELKGLQTGAIDYIIKPFNFELLLSKIRNVLAHNDTVRKTYQRQVQATPAAVQITSAEEAFVRNVLEVIEMNMGNPEFSVGELSVKFHASRSTFYKRLLLLTGKTPIEFIRHIRLKRAAELLEKSQLTVSEIAYTVGFNNPKNFSQYFKMEFDRIPSAYRSEKKNGHQQETI